MTELYINGYLAVLPAGLEFSIVEDNPFLTKSGEYSLNLELDLREPVNARIFGHVSRFNRKGNPDSLPAILVADSRVRMRGSAVIESHTDTAVKITLLSGNSELNWFIGADRKMEELDLGTEAYITQSIARDSWRKCYPESNFVCATVITAIDSEALNDYRNDNIANIGMMPYLLHYVQKIPEALGYPVVENQLLDDELFCRIYIPNTERTLQYNRILAGWTVMDFLLEIEKFCNIVFVIDREAQSVRIIRNYSRERNSEKIYVDEVTDEYEAEYDSENGIDVLNYERVTYDLPSDSYYRYRRLEESVLENVAVKEYGTYADMAVALEPYASNYNKREIYRIKREVLFGFLERDVDIYYIMREYEGSHYFEPVNEFDDAGKKDGNTVELKIIPAKIGFWYGTQAPVMLPEKEEEEEKNEAPGVIDLIEGGDNSAAAGTLQVAIFTGIIRGFPWSQTDSWEISLLRGGLVYPSEFDDDVQWDQLTEAERDRLVREVLRYEKFTLRLSGKHGLFSTNYSLNRGFASKEIWTVRFIPGRKISPQNTFVIKNREFICISLETKFNIHGALPVVEGKFYPVQ